ncbi:MATH and LRR domain-containing protein PFE0570w [Condylostylus longicornis]|uniref:MATH and LRR domain-containing protein PFE0570w n=1 Tax=Condylostylus longicornis TaxID=2530218 RepID=UPI00244DA147|nr:MATH and LRR domain-containing protein PFE0570w [Condylostylus longicornis]
MRFRPSKLLVVFIIIINIILFYYTWKSFIWKTVLNTSSPSILFNNKIIKTSKHLRKSITIVFRNIYNFENDLKSSIDSILEIIPNMPIIIIQDNIPYPPLIYENNITTIQSLNNNNNNENTVKFINLSFDINKTSKDLSALLAIKTKYVLFLPDSIRITSKNLLQKILKDIQNIGNVKANSNGIINNKNGKNNMKYSKKKHSELNAIASLMSDGGGGGVDGANNIIGSDASKTILNNHNSNNINNNNNNNNRFHSKDSSNNKNINVDEFHVDGSNSRVNVEGIVVGGGINGGNDGGDDGRNIVDNININNNINMKKDNNNNDRKLIIIPFAGNLKSFSSCTEIILNFRNWTIEYNAVNTTSMNCDLYLQKHGIFIDVDILKEMPDALASPFPEMFYIQAKIFKVKKKIFPSAFQDGKRLFTSYHTKQRRMEIRRKQFREMYRKLQIKRIVKRSHKIVSKVEIKDQALINPTHNIILDSQFSSSNFSLPLQTEIDLIGCERTTKSCIFPVYNRKPFYVYLEKHTPPCCLEKLKSVFHHVLDEFENVGIRYWLDNIALKSAIETGQLSPDAYEIDISFISFDLDRSNSLKKSQTRPFTDSDGFYWIKATDGQYFRVQFSKINQIGINLLPFEINANRVKPAEFFGWKAKEFSSEFLHPMSTVNFLGKNVMCPNNVREYLDKKNIN